MRNISTNLTRNIPTIQKISMNGLATIGEAAGAQRIEFNLS
jgi:hypothetical protein